MSAEEVAKAFVGHYYNTLETQVDQLVGLFNQSSMMTFEGSQVSGGPAIVEKFKTIGSVSHEIKTTDVQPSTSPNALLVFVTGAVKIGGGNPLHFGQTFQLVSTGVNQYYVHNSLFRLNYGL